MKSDILFRGGNVAAVLMSDGLTLRLSVGPECKSSPRSIPASLNHADSFEVVIESDGSVEYARLPKRVRAIIGACDQQGTSYPCVERDNVRRIWLSAVEPGMVTEASDMWNRVMRKRLD